MRANHSLRIVLTNELPNHRCVAQIASLNDIGLYGKIVVDLESEPSQALSRAS